MCSVASEAGAPLARRTLAFLEKAVARGMIEEDYSLLYRDFEAIGKVRTERGGTEGGRSRVGKNPQRDSID